MRPIEALIKLNELAGEIAKTGKKNDAKIKFKLIVNSSDFVLIAKTFR